ncbi:hypothetical protein ACERK3_18480 [Phycisphaerales bacterium AB-hyl4]|uniref:DUF4367 domain-containing protein n=1 Tax=Natronomicrosphaera hydrolytica TaxID=3242702 RepID=A0ABV4UBW3_9BACT
MHPEQPRETLLDRLTWQRLARLRSRPVDTSQLESWFDQQCGTAEQGVAHQRRPWYRPLAAMAAAIGLALLLGVVLTLFSGGAGGPTVAEPMDLVRLHHVTLRGEHELVPVDDLVEANRTLRAHAYEGPALPEHLATPVIGCCVHLLGDRPIGTALVQWEGQPVSIMTARTSEVHPPQGHEVQHEGRTYRVQQHEESHVVILAQNGQWIGAIGVHDAETLVRLLAMY